MSHDVAHGSQVESADQSVAAAPAAVTRRSPDDPPFDADLIVANSPGRQGRFGFMATLSNAYLQLFCADPTNENGNAGRVIYPPGCTLVSQPQQDNLTRTACWNWALNAGRGQPTRPECPTILYRDNNPVAFIADGNFGFEDRRTALPNTTLGADCTWPLNNLWLAARNEADQGGGGTVHRLAFMRAMAAIAAKRNGLAVAPRATPYSLHVTVPDYQWFSWQHWARVTYGGQTRYAQSDPGADTINCGYRRVWEADRPQFITASIHLTGFKQDHINVLRIWIHRDMRCETCDALKPLETGFNSRWHHCTSAACGRTHCGTCGGATAGRSAFSRTRNCSHCNTVTELLGDS